jgi:hypothetical protein
MSQTLLYGLLAMSRGGVSLGGRLRGLTVWRPKATADPCGMTNKRTDKCNGKCKGEIQGSVRLRCSQSAVSNSAQDDVGYWWVRKRTGKSNREMQRPPQSQRQKQRQLQRQKQSNSNSTSLRDDKQKDRQKPRQMQRQVQKRNTGIRSTTLLTKCREQLRSG